jgi:hypothetical protein
MIKYNSDLVLHNRSLLEAPIQKLPWRRRSESKICINIIAGKSQPIKLKLFKP